MSEQAAPNANCANCPSRAKSEARPKSLIARLCRWHTNWCPGRKAYQAELAQEGAATES